MAVPPQKKAQYAEARSLKAALVVGVKRMFGPDFCVTASVHVAALLAGEHRALGCAHEGHDSIA